MKSVRRERGTTGRRFSFKFRILHTNVKGWHTSSRISWRRRRKKERAQTLGAPKGYVRPTHTYGLQRVGLAALINIRFLKYLPHPIDVLARPWAPPASIRHRTPPPLAERSSKARYSICIFKLESLYTHSHPCTYACTRARPRTQRKASCHHHRHSPSPLPPPPASSSPLLSSSQPSSFFLLFVLFFLLFPRFLLLLLFLLVPSFPPLPRETSLFLFPPVCAPPTHS